jgi:hypothetical protein
MPPPRTGGPRLSTRAASCAAIHQRAATVPVILPVLMLAMPSRSMIEIAAAPEARGYSAARFRFGA